MLNHERLAAVLPIQLKGFPPEPPYGGLSFHSASSEGLQSQFEVFKERVISAIDSHRFLPIYRMADGEFAFLVGWRPPIGPADNVLRTFYWKLKEARSRLGFRSIETCWGESYHGLRALRAHRRMTNGIRTIASKGVIAAYFARRGDHWGEQYLEPVWSWMDQNGVSLTTSNYIPFYFVYALLSGAWRSALFKGRRILVVTTLTPERRAKIETGLKQEGVQSIDFISVSPGSALLDELPRSNFPKHIDLALVAAGIGSVNVLSQLEELSCPAIDCGMVLECIMAPERRGERPFLLPLES